MMGCGTFVSAGIITDMLNEGRFQKLTQRPETASIQDFIWCLDRILELSKEDDRLRGFQGKFRNLGSDELAEEMSKLRDKKLASMKNHVVLLDLLSKYPTRWDNIQTKQEVQGQTLTGLAQLYEAAETLGIIS
jgi:hypothetical protein